MKGKAGTVFLNIILLLLGMFAFIMADYIPKKLISDFVTLLGALLFVFAAFRFFSSVKNKA